MTYVLIMMAVLFIWAPASVDAQESMRFDNEGKKLEFIRGMLSKEKYLRLSEYSDPSCNAMMTDLLAGKDFKAIEPDVRADSADDPRLAKWHQCDHKDYHDTGVDWQVSYDDLEWLGWPPYRYYRIELDGNPENGPEDMIYHETNPKHQVNYNQTGYTWVDLERCEVEGGFPATGAVSRRTNKANAAYLNTLVYYKGGLWAVDFVDGSGLALMRSIDPDRMQTCQWLFSPPMGKPVSKDKLQKLKK